MLGLDPLQGHPRYTSIRTLAQNGRSFQQLALDRTTGEKVAIKFTPRGWDEGRNKYLLRELLIHQELSACHHPHIVELRDVFLTPTHLAAVAEYVEGEDLQTFLNNTGGRVSEALARFLFQQLVLALDFCHARGKVSRGVKLANTLLALCPGQLPLVKLADFGFSKDTAAHSAPASQVGTALFVPPEVMHNFGGSPYDGTLVDVWACGILLFMLLFGRHPCLRPEDGALSEQQQMLALFTRTAASQFCLLPQEAAAISPGCADLLGHMLKAVPEERYSMAQVQAHPWFKAGLPEGAAFMNATILAEAATRPLTLRHSPEALAALVRHGQQLDPRPGEGGSSLHCTPPPAAAAAAAASSPTAAVNIPTTSPTNSRDGSTGGAAAGAAAGRSGGSSVAGIAARVASSSAAVAAAVGGHSMEEGSWGAPPPARLLIHSSSSSDKAQGLLYKQQEQQMLRSGRIPPARFQMSESMSSSHGSFIGQGQQQRQQQQQQQEPINLLETIPSVPLEEVPEVSPQQGQFSVWLPQQQQHGLQPPSSSTTSAGAVAGGGSQGGVQCSSISGGCHQQQQQQVQSQSLSLQQQIQQQQAQLQALQLQQQQQQAAAAAAAATNGAPRQMSLLNSADLESLLPALADPAGAGAAPGSDTHNNHNKNNNNNKQQQQQSASPRAGEMEQQNSFMLLLQGIDSLPADGMGSNIDALLNPAANPLLDAPMPQQYDAQQQQLQQQQRCISGAVAAAASAGAVCASQQQQQGGHEGHDGPIEIPDDYAAFLVDDDDLAAVRQSGAGGRAAAVRSGAGGGVSSVSLDLRQLSDLLMGGSSAALLEGSTWHKLCRDSFSRSRGGAQRSGPAALGGGRDEADTAATGQACAVDDDEDDLHALLGLRDMSITHGD